MRIIFILVLTTGISVASFAREVNQATGNVHYNFEADSRTGNFSEIQWPKNCSKYKSIRLEAISNAILRCQAENQGEKCVIMPNSDQSISPPVITESDSELLIRQLSRKISISLEPDAHFFPFESDTESWYQGNCPSALVNSLSQSLRESLASDANVVDENRTTEPKVGGSSFSTSRPGTAVTGQ